MKNGHRLITALVIILALPGCATTMRGAPEAPFSEEIYSGKNKLISVSDKDVTDLIGALDTTTRNSLMTKMMALTDLRYSQFRREVAANRRHSASLSEGAVLTLDVVGGLVKSVVAKDNYIAATALISGGTNVFDRNYLYEQTITALVAQMDSSRKQKLLEIQTAMQQRSIDEYSGHAALNDVIDYYHAGSLFSAVITIQKVAATSEAEASVKLRELNDKTTDEIVSERTDTQKMTDRVKALDDAGRAKLAAFLSGKGNTPKSTSTKDTLNAMRDLRSEKYEGRFTELMQELDAVLSLPNK